MGNANLLKKLYLFKDLSDKEIDVIQGTTETKSYGPGDEVFSQGEKAHALYLIQSGSVKVHQTAENGDSIEITRIGPGSHFGEMSFLDGEPRSANASALEPTEILVVDYEKLLRIMNDQPTISQHFYKQFAHFLCGRLRVTTKDLSFSRSKILSHF